MEERRHSHFLLPWPLESPCAHSVCALQSTARAQSTAREAALALEVDEPRAAAALRESCRRASRPPPRGPRAPSPAEAEGGASAQCERSRTRSGDGKDALVAKMGVSERGCNSLCTGVGRYRLIAIRRATNGRFMFIRRASVSSGIDPVFSRMRTASSHGSEGAPTPCPLLISVAPFF